MAEQRDIVDIWMEVRGYYDDPSADVGVTEADVAALAAEMTAYFAEHAPDRTFALPDDYRRWLPHLGRHTSRGGTYGFHWYTPSAVVANTTYGCGVFDDFPMERRRIWLEIAHWSDKHDIFLCCDRDDPRFGALYDSHDNHFWLSPGALDREAASMTRYLRKLYWPMRRERRDHRKRLLRERRAAQPPEEAQT